MSNCPDGHVSAEDDYCSVCGLSMSSPVARPAAPAERTPEPIATVAVDPGARSSCPHCGAAHDPDDVFCESCGMDFASGTLPEPEPAVTSIGAGAARPPGATTEPIALVTVSSDAGHHARMDADGVLPFPDPVPPPVVIAVYTSPVQIGRAKPARGVHPDIDLASSPHEDPAASTRHAVFERRIDGGWWVTDLDSTNGTYVGEDAAPVVPHTPVPLVPGVPVFVGAWTRLVLTEPPPEAA